MAQPLLGCRAQGKKASCGLWPAPSGLPRSPLGTLPLFSWGLRSYFGHASLPPSSVRRPGWRSLAWWPARRWQSPSRSLSAFPGMPCGCWFPQRPSWAHGCWRQRGGCGGQDRWTLTVDSLFHLFGFGESAQLLLGKDERAVHGHFKISAARGDQFERCDLVLVFLEELFRQPGGLFIVPSSAAKLD